MLLLAGSNGRRSENDAVGDRQSQGSQGQPRGPRPEQDSDSGNDEREERRNGNDKLHRLTSTCLLDINTITQAHSTDARYSIDGVRKQYVHKHTWVKIFKINLNSEF